ncbi:MAG: hypothetical protein GY788_16480, partial [bacterium]|nr:hypothetical protein [bacterium]
GRAARLLMTGEEIQDPLNFLLSVMSDDAMDMWSRMEAASKILPFVRPKLKPVKVEVSSPKSHEDWLRELQGEVVPIVWTAGQHSLGGTP